MQRDNGLIAARRFDALTSEEHGVMGSYAIIGAHLPIAAARAWRRSTRDRTMCRLCFFGDGPPISARFHEALNFAAVWKLPLIFVLRGETSLHGIPRISEVTAGCQPAGDRASGLYGLEKIS